MVGGSAAPILNPKLHAPDARSSATRAETTTRSAPPWGPEMVFTVRTYATNAPDGYPPTAQIRSKPCLVHGKFLCAGRQHRDAIAKALSPIYTATTHFYQFSRTSRRYHPPQTLGYLLRAAQRVEGQTQLRRARC
jgi:hypothetical protein